MIDQIGFFDQDFSPIGIAEDLEYFLRMERILMPSWLTDEMYPEDSKWKCVRGVPQFIFIKNNDVEPRYFLHVMGGSTIHIYKE